jgi:hypothetical protein
MVCLVVLKQLGHFVGSRAYPRQSDESMERQRFRTQAVGFIDMKSGPSAAEQRLGVAAAPRPNDVASPSPRLSQPFAESPQ